MNFEGGLAISNIREQSETKRGTDGVFKFALAAAELAAGTRCDDVVLLDLRGRSPVTEFFLIATGTSPRQMRTVVDELRDLGKKSQFAPWQVNGYDSARWIVLDCVNVVIHVFDGESRDFYDLELLWGDAPRVDWRKELGLPRAISEEPLQARFSRTAGNDERAAEEEDARLDGRDLNKEEGDWDVDEDAEIDAPIVMELPDESTGSNSVEFVEIDPPAKRRQRGRAVFPTPIEEEEDMTAEEKAMHPLSDLAAAADSLDENDAQRSAEALTDKDVELATKEPSQRPRKKALRTRKDKRGPDRAAPARVNTKKAKAGVSKTKSKRVSAKKSAKTPALKITKAPKKKTKPATPKTRRTKLKTRKSSKKSRR